MKLFRALCLRAPSALSAASAIAFLLLATTNARAQFAVDWRTVEPGTRLTVGSFELTFVLAQPDASPVLAAGAFTFAGGYLALQGTSCPADVDDGSGSGTPDGGVDVSDLLYFLSSFEAGDISADLDNGSGAGIPDGGVDVSDLLFFLTRFEGGC